MPSEHLREVSMATLQVGTTLHAATNQYCHTEGNFSGNHRAWTKPIFDQTLSLDRPLFQTLNHTYQTHILTGREANQLGREGGQNNPLTDSQANS